MSSILAFIFILLKFVCRTESVRQRKHWVGHKNGQKLLFLWQKNNSFVALTQCNERVLRKWQKMPKKETRSKMKITLLRKLDLGTFYSFTKGGCQLKLCLDVIVRDNHCVLLGPRIISEFSLQHCHFINVPRTLEDTSEFQAKKIVFFPLFSDHGQLFFLDFFFDIITFC